MRISFSLASLLAAVGAVVQLTDLESRGAAGQVALLPGARPDINAVNYPSLQAAFDAAPIEGGIVRLPAGTFEIAEPLVLSRQDVRIEGAGTATHIKNVNRNGMPALIIQHPDGARVQDDERLWRIMLSNFRITGNEQSGHGIEVVRIQEIFIQGVLVSYHGGHGIFLNYCYEDPRITVAGNNFSNSYLGDGKVKRAASDLAAAGIVLEGTRDLAISGNLFSGVSPKALTLQSAAPTRNVLFSNNVLIDSPSDHGKLRDAEVDGNLPED